MYQCYCHDKDEVKKSTKGVPHSNKFAMDMFKDVLLDQSTPIQKVNINSLRLNKLKQISRISTMKTSLSDIFVKMRVADDKITCSPLMKDGQIL
jgi:hypothetical protein